MRYPASAMILTRFAGEHGVSVGECLRGTDLRPADLLAPAAVVSGDQELAVIANVLATVGDAPGLGIEVGVRYHVTTHGIWGFALISSRSVRQAVDVGLRYLELTYSYNRITAVDDGAELRLVIEPAEAPPALRRFVAERDIGIISTLYRELVGAPAPPRRVQLPYPEPDSDLSDRLTRLLGTRPEFGAEQYAVALDSSTADDPLPQADPHTAAISESQCRQLLEQRRALAGTAGRVRDLLSGRPHRPPTQDEVAQALNLSARTLRRRLDDEGYSYRGLVEEVRARVAEELLVDTSLPIGEIAVRLGYAEAASFNHAFRRWTGSSPRAVRAAQ